VDPDRTLTTWGRQPERVPRSSFPRPQGRPNPGGQGAAPEHRAKCTPTSAEHSNEGLPGAPVGKRGCRAS